MISWFAKNSIAANLLGISRSGLSKAIKRYEL